MGDLQRPERAGELASESVGTHEVGVHHEHMGNLVVDLQAPREDVLRIFLPRLCDLRVQVGHGFPRDLA